MLVEYSEIKMFMSLMEYQIPSSRINKFQDGDGEGQMHVVGCPYLYPYPGFLLNCHSG